MNRRPYSAVFIIVILLTYLHTFTFITTESTGESIEVTDTYAIVRGGREKIQSSVDWYWGEDYYQYEIWNDFYFNEKYLGMDNVTCHLSFSFESSNGTTFHSNHSINYHIPIETRKYQFICVHNIPCERDDKIEGWVVMNLSVVSEEFGTETFNTRTRVSHTEYDYKFSDVFEPSEKKQKQENVFIMQVIVNLIMISAILIFLFFKFFFRTNDKSNKPRNK